VKQSTCQSLLAVNLHTLLYCKEGRLVSAVASLTVCVELFQRLGIKRGGGGFIETYVQPLKRVNRKPQLYTSITMAPTQYFENGNFREYYDCVKWFESRVVPQYRSCKLTFQLAETTSSDKYIDVNHKIINCSVNISFNNISCICRQVRAVITQSVWRWATGWTIEVLGFDSRRGLGIFLFTTASRMALGATQPPIQGVPGALPLGVKRPGR
jgi:hypothetical protein